MKRIVGRRAFADLPDLDQHNLTAKVDTGAYRCALHCRKIAIKDDALCFTLDDGSTHKFKRWSKVKVKNTSGSSEYRYALDLKVVVLGKVCHTSVTLTDRSRMKTPMLLGRMLLHGTFVVDVDYSATAINSEFKL